MRIMEIVFENGVEIFQVAIEVVIVMVEIVSFIMVLTIVIISKGDFVNFGETSQNF